MKIKGIILIFGILLLGCEKEVKEVIRPVETVVVSSLPEKLSYEYPAIVIPETETMLAFKVAGPIEEMKVEVGSYVKRMR